MQVLLLVPSVPTPPKPEVPSVPLNGPRTGPGPAHTSSARAAATGRHAYGELHFYIA